MNSGDPDEIDGGMILQKTYLAETYDSLESVIGEVLDMAYSYHRGDMNRIELEILNPKDELR